jgi:hypothetical protein
MLSDRTIVLNVEIFDIWPFRGKSMWNLQYLAFLQYLVTVLKKPTIPKIISTGYRLPPYTCLEYCFSSEVNQPGREADHSRPTTIEVKKTCIYTFTPPSSVAFILWRVKQAANKLCWLSSMCKYNMQGSYSNNHSSGQRGSTIDH